MNYDILHELINRYENDMERIYGREHDELFKWKAMCTWRKEWLKSKDSFKDFSEQFTAAKKDCLAGRTNQCKAEYESNNKQCQNENQNVLVTDRIHGYGFSGGIGDINEFAGGVYDFCCNLITGKPRECPGGKRDSVNGGNIAHSVMVG